MAVKIADPILMREINKFHVLEAIRIHGRISRIEISKQTFLSATTVSAITSALIEEGLVEAVHTKSSEKAARGRPRVFLQLIADAAYMVGVMITQRKTSATIANFRGEPVHSLQLPVGVARLGRDVVVELLEDTIHGCIAESGVEVAKIKGIGIGTHELTDPSEPDAGRNKELGGYEADIAEELSIRMNLPVKAERSANLIALSESWFEHGGRDQAFVVVTVDEKVDICCVFNGEPFRGASGLGAAFGETKIGGLGGAGPNGPVVSLDSVFSQDASTRSAKCILKDGFDDSRAGARGGLAKLADLAAQGNRDAIAFFDEQGHALGQAVSHVVNLINPHRIIISFENAAQRARVESAFRESVERHSSENLMKSVEIILHDYDEDVSVRGTVALMLREIYSAPWTAY